MRSIASIFAAAILIVGLGASGPAPAQQPQQPHHRFVVDGKMWLASSPDRASERRGHRGAREPGRCGAGVVP